jgi:hypothetical protein
MTKQAENRVFDNKELEAARESLRRSIARWTGKGELVES